MKNTKREQGLTLDNDMVDTNVLKKMTLLERFVNDGSPTGLTWDNSSSFATCPRKSAQTFSLPLLRLSLEECCITGIVPQLFLNEDVYFPIHPDCVHLLDRRFHHQLVFTPTTPIMAMPTASPRTVFIESEKWAGFLKLDYPLILGRFQRGLSGEKLQHGLLVSSKLVDAEAHKIGIFHFPEIGSIEIQATAERRAGTLFREGVVVGPNYDELVTFCSLFGMSYFSDNFSNECLLVRFAHQHGGVEWIVNSVIIPLLHSFWDLVLEFGFWPEAHAQNIILGINKNGTTGIIWRDCQGFYVDEELSSTSEAACKYKTMTKDDNLVRKRSFLYDWILGHYVLCPLIEAVKKKYGDIGTMLTDVVAEVSRSKLAKKGGLILPEGKTYVMSLEVPNGRQLPLQETRNVIYR